MTDRDDTINRPFDASDVATFAQSQGWCPSSPDGMGPHRPDETTEPPTCAECGAEIESEKEATE